MSLHPASSGAFAKLLGVVVHEEPSDGSYHLRVDLDEKHFRDGGIVHGGLMMSMLDMAMAGAVTRTLAPEERTASASITTDFLAPATAGRLVASGRVLRRGALSAFPVGELRDGQGSLVARASGVWAIRKR